MARVNNAAFYGVGSIGFGRHPSNPKLWIAVDTNDKTKFAAGDCTILHDAWTSGKEARAWCEENKGSHASKAVKIEVGAKLNAVQEVEEVIADLPETQTNTEIDPEVE